MRLRALLRSPWLRGGVALAFLCGVGALLWWHGPKWADFKDAFASVVWEWVVVAVGFNLLSIVARAAAWSVVIRSAMPPPHPRPPLVFAAFCVGLLANAVLPGRVGELARVAVLSRRLNGGRKGLWPMLVGICVGAWLGAGLMTGDYAEWTRVGLGLSLAIYSAIGLFNLRMSLPRRSEPWIAPFVGIATGFIAAGTGVFVIPSGPYLQAIGLNKDEMVQALGITFTVSTVVLGGVVAHAGALNAALLLPTIVALIASLAGMWIGQQLRNKLREETFRKCFFAGMLLLGAHLALHPFL